MDTARTTEFLANLSQRGISLWAEGEHIRFKAPKGALTPELKAALLAHKPALLEILRCSSGNSTSMADSIRLAEVELSVSPPAGSRRQALVRVKPGGKGRPFFCVHPVGGNVVCYAGLARHLSPEQPFYAFQSPDHVNLDSIEAMATHYLACLRSVQAQGPFILGGWSMGGVVAFEMARQLRLQGQSAVLFLIDSLTPDAHLNHQLPDDRTLLSYFIHDLEGVLGQSLGLSVEALQAIEPSQRIHAVAELVRKQGIVPSDLGSDELVALFEIFKNNLHALLHYKPTPYDGVLMLIKSSDSHPDPMLGWSGLGVEIEMHEIEGDHYSIVAGSGAPLLAALLERKFASLSDTDGGRCQHNTAL